VARSAVWVVGLEVVAVLVAYLGFGWPVLLVGIPVVVGTVFVLLAVHLSEKPRERLAEARAARYEEPPLPGGLMSGFFEVPAPRSEEEHRARA
jgi:fatty acid desaturase